MKLLLDKYADTNTEHFGIKCNCLHVAAYYGHVDAVSLLIDRGVNVDCGDEVGEWQC